MRVLPALLIAVLSGIASACGGGSSPQTPTSPAPIPAADACSIVNALGSAPGLRVDILSGADCTPSDRSPVVKLNMKTAAGDSLGSCTGTIVGPRAVLTAAHCLDEDTRAVRVWLGSGPEFLAQSFVHYPGYSFNAQGVFDVGVVFMGEDLPRTPVPILTSRAARQGETAIIAGWGRTDNDAVAFNLRAGSTSVSAVNATFLQTPFAPPASSVCSGDSGGPILLSEGGRWAIGGITSATSGPACNEGTNFYLAVHNANVRDFILKHVPAIGQR